MIGAMITKTPIPTNGIKRASAGCAVEYGPKKDAKTDAPKTNDAAIRILTTAIAMRSIAGVLMLSQSLFSTDCSVAHA